VYGNGIGAKMPDEARKWLEELMEPLAELEHDRWSGWMRHQFENWTEENIVRWKLLMNTPYSELEEHSKESDRREVRKTLAVIEPHLHRLLAANETLKIMMKEQSQAADTYYNESVGLQRIINDRDKKIIQLEADRAALIKHIRDEFVVLSDELKKEIETD
jgi:signal recognition particle subunit SEC65